MTNLQANGSNASQKDAPGTDSTNRKTVCVFCGAREGSSPVHIEAARSLAHALHANNMNLVYGGGTVGVMGELAKTLVSLSGPDSVLGVIPDALLKYERAYENGTKPDPQKIIDEKTFGRTIVVEDMHTRKHMMAQKAIKSGGGFVALSGGYGTLEELMEIVTWNQLGIHASAIVVFNVDGYWDGLMQWVRTAIGSGFISENNADIMVEAKTGDEVVERLLRYRNAEGRFDLQWGEK